MIDKDGEDCVSGVVKALQQKEGEVFYCVEKEGQRKWYKRIAVILSVEQGDRLRAQYSLDPLAPPTPHIGIADVSLGMENWSYVISTILKSTGSHIVSFSEQHSYCFLCPFPFVQTSEEQNICQTALPSGSSVHVDKVFSSSLVEAFGPLPTSKSLFQGFSMVLTTASTTNASRCQQSCSDESSGLEEGNNSVHCAITCYNKYCHLTLYFQQAMDPSRCFLVCDRPNHGRSFLLALAAGIPCVSLPWLRDSCRLNERQDFHHYLLPTGYSLLSGKLIEWAPRKSPFLDLKVLLVSDKEDFLCMWSDVLMAGKAASTNGHRRGMNLAFYCKSVFVV
uniref:Tumour suppressor p53-binding protein-1 Tudor domain-containing protein n=1 Tax=Eptatretus burgeri TaxID=7764 RepID=A0A8C4R2N0_EPTBU